jgi:hypothetical protein
MHSGKSHVSEVAGVLQVRHSEDEEATHPIDPDDAECLGYDAGCVVCGLRQPGAL